MGIKLTLLILLCVSCGPQVKVPNELQSASALNQNRPFLNGIAIKNGTIYTLQPYGTVSKYSSKGAIKFYESIPQNKSIPVLYIGGSGKGEVIIEEIKKAP